MRAEALHTAEHANDPGLRGAGRTWDGLLMRLVRRLTGPRPRSRELSRLASALLSERGEASGIALAGELLGAYRAAGAEERAAFLGAVAEDLGPDAERVDSAVADYLAAPASQTIAALRRAAEPRWLELIRRLNLAAGATGELVRMREDLLRNLPHHPGMRALDGDFADLFRAWFNGGFLVLRRIDWTTPAAILDRIIRYEAVHAIRSWDDLRRRIEPRDRRCFAFFHPRLADDPLIFVEVALTVRTPDAIGPLLAEHRDSIEPARATTAVFYSISNCQPGLRGVSFGSFLIKQVVEALRRELPSLRRFVTLSPVPGFMTWLRQEREANASTFLTLEDRTALAALERAHWHAQPGVAAALRPTLLAAAAHYLLVARSSVGRLIDPVARFHLGNGARLERINWLGDVSSKGLAQSGGLMVNYLYDPAQIVRNHEAFVKASKVVSSRAIRRLLRAAPGARGGEASPGGAEEVR